MQPIVTSALLLAALVSASPPVRDTALAELTLDEALAELDRQGPGLAQARARSDEAASLSRQAAAGLLPALTATGGYTRNSDEVIIDLSRLGPALPPPVAASLPGPIAIQPLETFSGTLALRLPLVIPTAWYDTAAARHGARGAAAQADAARLSGRAVLVATAHLSLAAEEAVLASERAAANAARLAESAERKLQAGTAAPLDALRARTEQVKREGDLVRARADLERARLSAGVLLGRDAPVRILVGDRWIATSTPTAQAQPLTPALSPEGRESQSPTSTPTPTATTTATTQAQPLSPALSPAGRGSQSPTPTPPDDALVAEALAHRAEVTAAAAQVSSAEAQVGSAWARLAPQLSATGSAFAADVPFPTGKKEGWRLTLDLTWPLYDGGLRYGKRGEAEARLRGAQAAAVAQRLAVSQEARDAARDEAVALERLRLAVEQRRLADQAAGTAQRGYEAGVASSLDVVDADDRLYLADLGLAEARARLATARVALARALGRGP